MLKIALVDANKRANKKYAGIVSSIVGGWLVWEAKQKGIELLTERQAEADIILLAFAGAMDYLANGKSYLRRSKIEPDPHKRNRVPYIIAGGPVDASPFEAIQIADAFAVGEAYNFIREFFSLVQKEKTLNEIRAWITDYPHAIEREQLESLARDLERPWLLASPAPKLAAPDEYVDWMGTPPIRGDDKVVRLLGSKGCHCKCTFCATTYRQTYRINPNDDDIVTKSVLLELRGERVQILSNDPANLKWWPRIQTKMDSQSFTIMEMRDPATRENLKRTKVGIARFGVEGVSERIRGAFGKPIKNQELLDITAELHEAKINTRWFMIMGAPFENKNDWENFKELHYKLARLLDFGVCQIKLTAFVPNPPAPLVRYLPSFQYNELLKNHVDWVLENAVSRHVMCYYGNKRPSQVKAIAEQLAVAPQVIDHLADIAEHKNEPFDLLPALEDAHRATWEVIQWPLSTELRWKMGGYYRNKMTKNTTSPVAKSGV